MCVVHVCQMSSSAASRAADHKTVASAPTARLTALCAALSDLPKVVVHVIDEYLSRLPPSDLIRELSRAISPVLKADAVTSAQPSWTSPVYYMGGRIVRTFYNGPQLRKIIDDLCFAPEPNFDETGLMASPDNIRFDQVLLARSIPSELLRELHDAKLSNDTVSPAVRRLMAEDAGGLCCVTLSPLLWCTLLLAVPLGSSADQVLCNARDGAPLQPLLNRGPLCGLCLYRGRFD
jgi:hypothetical protein